MAPTVGRIVHFRENANGRCQAAIVTAPPNDDGAIEVVLFRGGNDAEQPWAPPSESTQWRTGVLEQPEEGRLETPSWHWPEREEERPQTASSGEADKGKDGK